MIILHLANVRTTGTGRADSQLLQANCRTPHHAAALLQCCFRPDVAAIQIAEGCPSWLLLWALQQHTCSCGASERWRNSTKRGMAPVLITSSIGGLRSAVMWGCAQGV